MADWTAARKRRAVELALPVLLAVAMLGGALWLKGMFDQADTTYYLNLAAGKQAILPFASRQLGPLLVRGLVRLTGLSIVRGFMLEGVLSLLCFALATLYLLVRSGAPRYMLAAIAGLFFWALQFNSLVLPDLFYAALLSGFLLLLERERFILAGLMMFPLVVARESTLLTLVCLLFAGWRLLRLREAAVAVLSLLAGILIVKHLTANALPNTEHISPGLYLLAKMPWNLLKNFFGVDMWANVYTACGVPRYAMDVHLGPLHRVGLCGFTWRYPLLLFNSAIISFGLLPLLVIKVRRQAWALIRSRSRGDLLLRFCVVYGVLSFALAGMLGESFPRLFAYSWPLFLVALPRLLASSAATFRSDRAALVFLALHLLVSWCGMNIYIVWIGFACALLYGLGWWLLRRSWGLPGTAIAAAATVHSRSAK